MRSRIYSGITGVLKIICSLIIGIMLGGLGLYGLIRSVPFMEAKNNRKC
ncbi:MAG: hypothetical protein KBS96_07305 [Lachnospiraceae bacterium]|nr:hypothetical protein [Candidatus Colinaster scatohippi]